MYPVEHLHWNNVKKEGTDWIALHLCLFLGILDIVTHP